MEAHGALLRDRAFQLAEPALQLRRVVGIADLDAHRSRGRRAVARARGTSEREVLQREAERLRVGEAPLEQVQARLQRRELVVVELERRQEVAFGAEGVELFTGVLVALRVERYAEADELGTVGVETPREGLVAHLLVALDVPLDVAGGERPQLGHQERDQRELADQLVGVVAHPDGEPTRVRLSGDFAALEVLV